MRQLLLIFVSMISVADMAAAAVNCPIVFNSPSSVFQGLSASKSQNQSQLETSLAEFNRLLLEYAKAQPLLKSRLEIELQAKYLELQRAGVDPQRLKPVHESNIENKDAKQIEAQAERSAIDKQKLDPSTWQPLRQLKYPNTGYSTRLKFTLDSKSLLAYGPFYDSVRILDVLTGDLKGEIKQTAEIALSLSLKSEFLISTQNEIMRIDLDSSGHEKRQWKIDFSETKISGIVHSRLTQKIYALINKEGEKSTIYEIDPNTGEFTIRNLPFYAYEIHLQDAKKPQIILSVDDMVTKFSFLDPDTFKVTSTSRTEDSSRYTSGIEKLEFTQVPGQALVVSSVNGKAAIWDFKNNKLIKDYKQITNGNSFYFTGSSSPANDLRAAFTYSNLIEFYDKKNKSLTTLEVPAPRDPHAFMFSPNGQIILIVGEGGNALIIGNPMN